MKKIAIFISGSGTNMKAIIEAVKTGVINAEISFVFSNKADALGLKFAKNMGITTEILNHKNFNSRLEFDMEMLEIVKKHQLDLICLAGFMRLLTKEFLQELTMPIINIHPSLLPDFKGANAVRDAFEADVKRTGCTVHYVVPEMDAGEIIVQKSVDVTENDSFGSLRAKILEQEHIAYVEAINKIHI
jgi:phosphoribosylglycinamide formyltransferase-1